MFEGYLQLFRCFSHKHGFRLTKKRGYLTSLFIWYCLAPLLNNENQSFLNKL